ncbi:MAG: 50S ribosomal protein L9 [Candidatus Omnitrophica bacterium]|nr:50S ribosomal protein L9 [Candidatus Omnitrophota bacterium]
MEVILKTDVDKIGKAGSVVKVKDGFARNFLLPNGLAIACTQNNLKKVEDEKQKKVLEHEKEKKEAEALQSKLAALSLTIPVLAQDEKTYGSISAHDVAEALKEEGFEIDKNIILLDEPIKSLGIYEVSVKLHPEVIAKVKIWVVKK